MLEANKQLSSFIQDVAEKLKTDKLDNNTKMELVNFYMKCNSQMPPIDEISEKDLLKFLCMGWYIYNELGQKNKV